MNLIFRIESMEATNGEAAENLTGEDFPSLNGKKTSATSSNKTTDTLARKVAVYNTINMNKGSPSTEDFPALGGNPTSSKPQKNVQNSKPPEVKSTKPSQNVRPPATKKQVKLSVTPSEEFPSLVPPETSSKKTKVSIELKRNPKQKNVAVNNNINNTNVQNSKPSPQITNIRSSQNITVHGLNLHGALAKTVVDQTQTSSLSDIGASILPEKSVKSKISTVEVSSAEENISRPKPAKVDSIQDFPSLGSSIAPARKTPAFGGSKATSVEVPVSSAWKEAPKNVSKNEDKAKSKKKKNESMNDNKLKEKINNAEPTKKKKKDQSENGGMNKENLAEPKVNKAKEKDRKKSELKIGTLSQPESPASNHEIITDNFPSLGESLTNGILKMDIKNKLKKPPPGFQSSIKIPPGFSSVETGFKPSDGPVFTIEDADYTQPKDFTVRNAALINLIQDVLQCDSQKFEKFRILSQDFRTGQSTAGEYYSKCLDILGNEHFFSVFVELLVLLPDIKKQKALYEVFVRKSKKQIGKLPKLEVCYTCQQVVLEKDFREHNSSHTMDYSFPAL